MSEVNLMSLYITPFLIEVFFEKEKGLFHIVTFRFKNRETFVQLSEHVCSSYNFAVLVCLKEIIEKNSDINTSHIIIGMIRTIILGVQSILVSISGCVENFFMHISIKISLVWKVIC